MVTGGGRPHPGQRSLIEPSAGPTTPSGVSSAWTAGAADGLMFVRLDLPRWDTAWEVKRRRGGWPAVSKKTGKVLKHRKVWDRLTGNARTAHWSQRSTATKTVIAEVVKAAEHAGLQPCRHLTVQLVWAPGNNRKADPDNLWPLLKVLADGLARGPRKDLLGLHLVPDDDAPWMTKLGPRIDRPPTPAGLWLEITMHTRGVNDEI